jgi:arylsulfatase A
MNKFSRGSFLKAVGFTIASLIASSLPAATTTAPKDSNPNIVYILADDLGWAELGCFGNKFNETPNIDKLAKQGMLFTNAYAAAPVCSPYRAALMTGQYPARIGITDYLRPNTNNHLSLDYITMAEMFQSSGYVTGIVGKWHLSGHKSCGAKEETLPDKHGFDEVMVSEKTGIGGGCYFYPYTCVDPSLPKKLPGDTEYLTDRQNIEAVEFIERHKNHPFFLYLSHYAVHTTLNGKPDSVKYFEAKLGAGKGNNAKKNNPHLAAQLKVVDDGVGMIMNKLEELGIAQNTIIVFTGDNGGEDRVTSNAPLRAGKSTTYEGGIRVPLVIKWPGKITPNSTCSVPTMNIDFYPTFAEITGSSSNMIQHIDGTSIIPLFKGGTIRRDTLYWHYPLDKPHFLGGRSSGAIRKGNWKLIEFFDDGHFELYNLKDDISETKDLSLQYPEKLNELKTLLSKWRNDVGAKSATGTPDAEK